MEINWLGHATFELVEGDTRVLIDPFLSPNNPAATLTADDVEPTHVLVTHGHQDHLADAAVVGKRTGAKFIALTELAGWLKGQGIEDCVDPNLGGTVPLEGADGTVKLVQALHSSTTPDGTVTTPAGMIVTLGGTTVYHLGDTCLFSDLKLIGELHDIDVAIIPIGGHYTMDRHDAVLAAEMIGAETVIPGHYNTFPAVETDADAFKADVEAKTSSKVVLLGVGDSHTVGATAAA